jgi:hypothetical protein
MLKTRGKRIIHSRNKTYRLKYKPRLASVYEGSNESNSSKSEDYIFAKRSDRSLFVKKSSSPKTKKNKSKTSQKSFVEKITSIFNF